MILPVATGILLEASRVDLLVGDALYAAQGGQWGLRDAWWTKHLLHDGGQTVTKLIAVAAGLVCAASLWATRLARFSRASGYLCLLIALSALGAGVGKQLTNVACPWDLGRYGGERPYIRLFEPRSAAFPAARCFPGGHASGGFALLGLYFVAGSMRWRCPPAWLIPGLAIGALFAVTQWLRGAHFPSHDLWTAGGCWALSWCLFRYVFRQRLAI